MSARLRVAVVGLGVGKSHVEGLLTLPDLFEVAAVCDIDAARAAAVAKELGIKRSTASLDDLVGDKAVDVIDLATPPHLHVPQAIRALAAGQHVICEKPVAGSLAEFDRLARAEARSGRRVMPIFQYRWGNGLQKLKRLIDRGIAGPAYMANVDTAWRRRAAYYAVPWRGKWATELGGCLVTHSIHAHDLLCYVLGPVRSVFARAATRVNPIEVEDCAAISFEMASGAFATSSVTLGSPAEISRHRFAFAHLSAESSTSPYNNGADPWIFKGDTPEIEARIVEALKDFKPGPERYAGQFLRFHAAMANGGDLPVTMADARRSLELITAIYRSARAGKAVALPLRRGDPDYRGWLPPPPARKRPARKAPTRR